MTFTPGEGKCIHTYKGDGNPLPSFEGVPYTVTVGNNIEETARRYWDMLNQENRVALLVKHINVENGNVDIHIIKQIRIINRHTV